MIFILKKKKKKKKNKESKNNTLQHLFCNEFLKASHISRNQSDATKFFPLKLHFSTKPPSLWTCLLYLDLFCSFVSRVCPKVTISPLDAILAYERFQRNAVLWIVGGGKLYMYVYNQLSAPTAWQALILVFGTKQNKILAPWVLSSVARRITSNGQYIYHMSESGKYCIEHDVR